MFLKDFVTGQRYLFVSVLEGNQVRIIRYGDSPLGVDREGRRRSACSEDRPDNMHKRNATQCGERREVAFLNDLEAIEALICISL